MNKLKIKYLLIIIPVLMLACSTTLTTNVIDKLPNATASPTISKIPSPTITPVFQACTVSTALHMRKAPRPDADVITWLRAGDVLTIQNDQAVEDWIKVKSRDNLTGWINSNYCERKQP